MSNGKLLRQLIRSGAEGDLDAFRGVAKKGINSNPSLDCEAIVTLLQE